MAQQELAGFLKEFNILKLRVESLLSDKLNDTTMASEELHNLSRFVSENAPNIPGYEMRKAQMEIIKLKTEIQLLEESTRSQRKFKFSRKNNIPKPIPPTNEPSTKDAENPTTLVETLLPTLSNLKDETIVIDPQQSSNKDIWLNNLNKSTVIINGVPSALHMTCLVDCQVIVGPVRTSVFLEDCSHSTFALGCQQLRIHKSNNCDFYLHIGSRVIVEDCSGLRFAPYSR